MKRLARCRGVWFASYMADEKDDVADQWGAQFDGREDAPGVGVNKEMLRKALKLNPAMRGNNTTADVMKTLEKASAQRTVATSEEPGKKAAPRDLVSGLTHYRERFHEEKKRLQNEIAELQKQMQQLGPQTLDRVVDLFLQVDPNLTSITTQEMLKVEGQFLNEIQFSAKKIIEKKLKKK